MNCASSRTWLFELEPEVDELLGAAAVFGVGGPRPLRYPNEGIVPEEKKNQPYVKHKSLRLFFLVFRRPNS